MSQPDPAAPDPTRPPPAERSSPPERVPPPADGSVGGPPDPVDLEWDRIERERVEEEIDEAQEDLAEAIAEPQARSARTDWMWVAFAVALVAGGAFATWVNLSLVRPAPEPPAAAPSQSRSPSPSELGPGMGFRSGADAEGAVEESTADPTGGAGERGESR